MRDIKTLGLLGTGVIGSGWAARVMHCGIDVIAADNNPAMEDWIRASVDNAMPSLDALTADVPTPAKGSLRFTTSAAEMAAESDFIQESVPEVLDIKHRVFAEVSATAPADVIIASSTSGFMPSELQQGMTHPERFW
jgi:carnitine 3-dehydrogenase